MDKDQSRIDPTSLLPEEPMTYELKKKKKKKKKKNLEDPLKESKEGSAVQTSIVTLDPEVSIKVENIEVELDFNDFSANGNLMLEAPQSEDSQEPEVKIEEQNREAVLLTFENVINDRSVYGYSHHMTPPARCLLCNICHLIFQNKKTLRLHQRRKHKIFRKSFRHICDSCGMSYEMKNSLVAHIKRKHGPNSSAEETDEKTCELCALVFKGSMRLRMHMRRKHGSYEDSFKHVCTVCGLTYDKERSLIVHMQRKHSNSPKPQSNEWYNCPFCPKVFTKRETYSRHVQRKHKIPDSDDLADQKLLENCQNAVTGEITCKECPLVFASLNYLKLHMRRKHNALKDDFRLKCKICNLSYDKIESLKRHVRRKHENKIHCVECNKYFDSNESFVNHSHKKIVRECQICGSIFASQGGLSKHLRCTHKIKGDSNIRCSVCNEGFQDDRHLKLHYMKSHLKVSYTCFHCSKVFKAKESYRRHVLIKHPSSDRIKKEMQKCDQCSETFADEFSLCKHIDSEHSKVKIEHTEIESATQQYPEVKEENIKGNFQCTKCPEDFVTWDELKCHYELNHHIVQETQCQICGDLLPALDLQKHIKLNHTHTFMQCKYCKFTTTNKASLTQHMLRHKNAETLNCDFNGCKYKTFYEDAMSRHRKKHAEIGVKLQCTRCPFQTMNKYILRYHEEAHVTGKKRYTCDQCEYATILPANLVQHKYKHSSEKRFKCDVCPFATKYNTSLRFHVKKKHCDLPVMN